MIQFLKPFTRIFTFTLFLLSLSLPAGAESLWDGQSYFGASGMVAGARNSRVEDATGQPDPRFTNGAEVITNVGYGVSLSLGWLFNSNWRVELELSRRSITLDNLAGPAGSAALNGNLTAHAAFFNIAKDFRGQGWVTPYFGLGVGFGVHELDLERVDTNYGMSKRTPTTPAFQAMFGVELEVGEDTDIVLGYRYVNYYAPDYSEFSYDFVDFHNLEVGLRFYIEDW